MRSIRDRLLGSFTGIDHGFGSAQTATPPDVVLLQQRHTNIVMVIDDTTLDRQQTADAMLTNIPEIAIGIKTADCLPILFYDPDVSAIGAIHAGWRGLANRVISGAIERLCTAYAAAPGHLYAAIGPAICRNCYEVGAEVTDSIARVTDLRGVFRQTSAGKGLLDTTAIALRQMEAAGIPASHLSAVGLCTHCSGGFHSYRAGSTGRQVSYIRLCHPGTY